MPVNLLTSKEVAKILKISVGELYKMKARNEGPPFLRISEKPTGAIRYDLKEIEDWLIGRENHA